MWHGVPIVTLPWGVDQPDMAARVAHQGAGIALPYVWFVKEEQLYQAMMRVLTEPSFKEKAKELSVRLRSHKRTGLQRAAGMHESTGQGVRSNGKEGGSYRTLVETPNETSSQKIMSCVCNPWSQITYKCSCQRTH